MGWDQLQESVRRPVLDTSIVNSRASGATPKSARVSRFGQPCHHTPSFVTTLTEPHLTHHHLPQNSPQRLAHVFPPVSQVKCGMIAVPFDLDESKGDIAQQLADAAAAAKAQHGSGVKVRDVCGLRLQLRSSTGQGEGSGLLEKGRRG